MRVHSFIAGIAAMLFAANTSIAQQADDAVAPFVDSETLVVMRAELGPMDPNATLDWLVERVNGQGLDRASRDILRRWWKPSFDKWGGLMTDARDAGAKRAYWLLTLTDVLDAHGTAGVWIVPVEGETKVQRVIDSLHRRGLDARQVKGVVVGSPAGRSVVPGAAATLPAAWARALAAEQEVLIRVAIVPTQVLRKSFEENVPSLPLAGGSVPITTLTRGIEWIGLSIALPPNPQVSMVLQAPDAPAARAIADLVERALVDMREYKARLRPELPAPAELADLLEPTVAGDQVRWEPDFQKVVMPVIMREVMLAARQRSAMNMRQIMQGLFMYANNHKGQTPADLDALIKDQDMSPEVLVDPLNPKERVGFIYVRPTGDWQKTPPGTAVLYESTPDGHNIAFADGHVEWLDTRKEVEDLVKAAEARNRAAEEGKK